MTIKHKFIQFLKENKAYESFLTLCCKNAKNENLNAFIKKLLNNNINPFYDLKIIQDICDFQIIVTKWENIIKQREKDLFITFLKENSLADLFNERLMQFRNTNLETYCKYSNPYSIRAAFGWAYTPEGCIFWRNVNDAWTSFRKEKTKITATF